MVQKRSPHYFEVTLSQFFGMHSSFLTRSGSTAIIVAMQANHVAPGKEVIVPASCCPIVLFSLQMAGYEVVLADVSASTLNCRAEDIKQKLSANTGAILAVHGYGRYCDIEAIVRLAQEHAIPVIEDACLAYGGQLKGRPLGGIANTSVISFGYDKPISMGFGGAVLTNDSEVASRIPSILGHNLFFQFQWLDRLDDLAHEFEKLPSYTSSRLRNIAWVHDKIVNPAFIKLDMQEQIPYWRYPVLINSSDRARFLLFAQSRGQVFTHHYQSLGTMMTQSNVPVADEIGRQILNIFVKSQTPNSQLIAMIETINEFEI
ncbi:DegT/DnrJ/EryC1/StrS family aminotransferase [Pseudoalteromonas sp. SMS1]|uniref:DegT/DnrJ/EryC1/StrS family aminotransferase n=1 Tax=Pseudoalteromonas sp. SMS1 TaxID=2908894 RepID=UPI001F1CF38A|nr:DegT/DnrJ/EryC1/StrS family aminotransferase [Pseudoalteromonas sp. SMS1]MCF2859371.1 DegT/DnrJ/EryC1/StrS family aminotransferase [Pseudoalteromonas sp. SMS1]